MEISLRTILGRPWCGFPKMGLIAKAMYNFYLLHFEYLLNSRNYIYQNVEVTITFTYKIICIKFIIVFFPGLSWIMLAGPWFIVDGLWSFCYLSAQLGLGYHLFGSGSLGSLHCPSLFCCGSGCFNRIHLTWLQIFVMYKDLISIQANTNLKKNKHKN